MKKTTFLLIVLIATFTLNAQTKRVYVIFTREGKPERVYSNMDDYIPFISNKPFYANETKLHGVDTLSFSPDLQTLKEDIYYPVQLAEKYLAKTTVYVTIQKYHDLASAVFIDLEVCKAYAENRKEKYFEVPYFYRNQASYNEVAKWNKNIYRNKSSQ